MFPNVRLMLVAGVASLVGLSFAFGLFATFRVNHEPLARLPPVSAPVQFIEDSQSPTSATMTSKRPFDSRFQFGRLQTGDAGAEETASIAPSTQPAAGPAAAEPAQQTAPIDDEPQADSAPSSAPVEQAALPAPEEQAPLTAPEEKSAAQDTQNPEAGSDPQQDAPTTVAVAPPADQSPPADQTTQETKQETDAAPIIPVAPPPTAVKAAAKAATQAHTKAPAKTAHKPAARQHVAAGTHRARRPHALAVAASQPANQRAALLQPTFQSAPPIAIQGHPVRVRHVGKKRAVKNTAVGGPFIPTGN